MSEPTRKEYMPIYRAVVHIKRPVYAYDIDEADELADKAADDLEDEIRNLIDGADVISVDIDDWE